MDPVIRNSSVPVDRTSWGSLQWLVGKATPTLGLTVGRVTFKPGQSNPAHLHPNCEEVLFVVEGEIEHTLPAGGTTRLGPGDCILLPRGGQHQARNIGTSEAVVLVVFNSSDRQTCAAETA